MDRREVLRVSSLILGYSLTAGTAAALLGGCKADTARDWIPRTISNKEADLLAEICETILPKTDTPGAKDALCHRYIDEMVTNFYSDDEKNNFKSDLKLFDDKSKEKHSKIFIALNSNERESILGILSDEAKNSQRSDKNKSHIFSTIKQATISGYFTSEVGAKGGLCEFLPVPGPFKGCIDYSTVGKAYVL